MLKSLETRSLRALLPIIFALIFAIPLLIFIFCIFYFNLLNLQIIHFSLIGYLTFSLIGYMLLRGFIDRIVELSEITANINIETLQKESNHEHNELEKITHIFHDLVQRLEENTENLNKRIYELSTLQEMTEISLKITDLKQLFTVVLEKLIDATNSNSGAMLSLSKDGKRLKREVVQGMDGFVGSGNEIDLNKTISGRIIQENITIKCDDPSLEKGYHSSNDEVFNGRPFIAKPIKAKRKSIGVLNLAREINGRSFQDAEVNYVTTVLGHIAFAIDNAQLIREMNDAYTELKAMQEKLIDYERMAAINQTVVTLSDKINNPLTIIQGHIELIRKNCIYEDPKLDRSLAIIEESISKCKDNMMKLQDIPASVVKDYVESETKMIDINYQTNNDEKEQSVDNKNPGLSI